MTDCSLMFIVTIGLGMSIYDRLFNDIQCEFGLGMVVDDTWQCCATHTL